MGTSWRRLFGGEPRGTGWKNCVAWNKERGLVCVQVQELSGFGSPRKLKIGIMQASRSIPIGNWRMLGRYCGGLDWRLEFRAAAQSGKDLKYGLRSDPPGALHPPDSNVHLAALTPFPLLPRTRALCDPRAIEPSEPDHERRELADQGGRQPASICFFIENDQWCGATSSADTIDRWSMRRRCSTIWSARTVKGIVSPCRPSG